ncbi:MAG: TetR/AcrR family transcriptional regulator [Anaerolineales bacterium]|nr:TetR/AcrR family transcriptional regulator [Anaerolineales bacterium]
MDTREKILDTALTLFNKEGTAAVSTNHIAEAAGISPGNLYYHFHNKQEIIRELFQRLNIIWETLESIPQDHAPVMADLKTVIEANYKIIWQYRFLYRELVALLRQDTELRTSFLAVRQRGFDGFHELLHMFSEAGVLDLPDDPKVVNELQEICWLISEFWLTNLEVNGLKVNEAEMQRGVNLIFRVIQPYLA